ncbi:nitroreductase family protein [Saccharomonospora cyanea]|uniref:Nitroreductase n=1 Tax=Saccharomonospora cyanea NA-134 TaxID=882082 RepID=H5XMP4_9PSEU|nr:nitroreductase family protein [Saccharomonospora cyanea]EHR61023.1 nitroreductase [Saccharomonospora cyanea NA-134]
MTASRERGSAAEWPGQEPRDADAACLAALVAQPAVRRFDPQRTVSSATVARLVDIARRTGSARNRQPWRFVEVRDRGTLEHLSRLGAYAQFLARAPVALAIASEDNGFADTEFDVGRVTQTIVLAAAAHGLGSCPATLYPSSNLDEARKALGLSRAWLPRHVLALGYRHEGAPPRGVSTVPRGRLPLDALLSRRP